MLKQMKLDERRLTIDEMKKSQVVLTMDTGAKQGTALHAPPRQAVGVPQKNLHQ